MPEPLPETAGELVKKAVEEKWAIYSLSSGLESLPQAMLTALTDSGVTVHLNQPCTGLKFDGNSSQVWTFVLIELLMVYCAGIVW